MSDQQSLSTETAFTVASTFLAYYYSEFVKVNELARMSDLYDERSYMTLVDFRDEVPVVAHGRSSVANLLAKLDSTLGQRKVEILTVDTVSLAHNCVQVICQGVMYLREYRRVFLHVFILEPTAYRTKTYHIASDYLRFVDSEKEVIPEGSVVIAADQVDAYLEESRIRMEQEQRRQFLEFQQRIRQQQQLHMQQQQQQQKAAAETAVKMGIPAPASREGRLGTSAPRGPSQPQEQQQRTTRPPRDSTRPSHADGQREPRGERKTRDGPREHRETRDGPREHRETRDGPREHREPRDVQREPRENCGERKPRESREPRGERKPREKEEKGAPASLNRPAVEGKKSAERGNRKPVPPPANAVKGSTAAAAPDASTQAPAAGRKPPRESGPTAAIIMLRVPKKIKLSDIKAELLGKGIPPLADLFWFGRDSAHAVAKFSSVEEATTVLQKMPFSILGETVKMNYFHE
ncbi:hypothetical protein JKF63_05017 [Porcisia hertigi]|uniref:NTF2 domain-containing protein n=1 Tax=Porcisia hertigi TaxID=2761500 RepID=A0A836IHK3_9TRYP|nr:hypothetical protein JKF63_05017 [Porcisia hertigi]